jgi:predicted PhzF superfamily epimerase YddE/YHI9
MSGSRARAFAQVDVFTHEALRGNPVAVVLDPDGLDAERMLAFTEWTNLSEATFVSPPTHPDADYAVRIFCPGRELPFAGHPTLGSCHAWLEAGGVPRGDEIVQECGLGLVRLRRDDAGTLAFASPPRFRSGPLSDDELEAALRFLRLGRDDVVAHEWCDNGPGWRGLLLRSAEAVLALDPDPAALAGLDVGVVGPHPAGEDVDYASTRCSAARRSTSPRTARCCTSRCARRDGRVLVVDGVDVVPEVHAVLDRMAAFADRVRSGAGPATPASASATSSTSASAAPTSARDGLRGAAHYSRAT